jgi:rRNA maturation endonuclease Nob1
MPSWRCQGCREENPGEFEYCWSCGQSSTAPTAGAA